MTQSVVTVRLNGHPYHIGCDAGQESHIEKLGREIDAVLKDLVGSVGQIGEARLLAMASLILADLAHSFNQPAQPTALPDVSAPESPPESLAESPPESSAESPVESLGESPVGLPVSMDEAYIEELALRLNTAAKTINQLATSLPKA